MPADQDLIDDDPDVSAAVSSILAKGPEALGDGPKREDTRENRTDREAHEEQEDGEIDDRVETNGKEGAEQAADTEEEAFLEIPGETEDAEPVKVPLSEAAEAVKQLRQMNGDVAAAVIKAENEAYAKQDEVLDGMAKTYREVAQKAQAALHLMDEFMPQPPPRVLLDERSEHYDPVRYNALKAQYDDFVAFRYKVEATIGEATEGVKGVQTEAQKAEAARENARMSRYIPEWGDEKAREAKKAEITSALNAKYGTSKEDFQDVVSHKAWRMLADLAKLSTVQTKAPEIKKAVQEKAAKIVNGKLPPRDNGSGRFISEARNALRETGSIDAAARLFIQSGLTKRL